MEIPKGFIQIEGYEKYYINKEGIILTTHYRKPKEMIGKIDKDGYRQVGLYKEPYNRVHRRVHRLVGKMFIPNPNNYPIINHKNGIKDDNRVENLEWCTHSYNSKHSFRVLGNIQQPTTNKKLVLRNIHSDEVLKFESRKQCAEYFDYTSSHLSRLTSGLVKWEKSRLKDYEIIE